MTSVGKNPPAPVQEKLEWVTPKISLMGIEENEGKGYGNVETPPPSGDTDPGNQGSS